MSAAWQIGDEPMIFDAVRKVLSDLDEAGFEQLEDDWDDHLRESLANLEGSYRELRNPNRDLIDYGTLSTQVAYLFRYIVGHAEFAAELLKRIREKLGSPLFKGGELRVASLGGGPGSELLGLLKYLSSPESGETVTKVACTIFDKEAHWEHLAEALLTAADCEIEIELSFERLDIVDSPACAEVTLADFDLVFMSFFVSEICALPQAAAVRANMNMIMGTVSRGAFLLYNDSNAYSFYTYMNGRASAAGRYEQIVEIEDNIAVEDRDLSGIFEEFEGRFDYRPKLSGNLVAKFFRRN